MLQKQINSYESVEGLRTSAKNVIYWTIQYSSEKGIFYHWYTPPINQTEGTELFMVEYTTIFSKDNTCTSDLFALTLHN